MHVILLFTFGYSLKLWEESGALDRELKFYNEVLKDKNIRYTFVTYGDEQEELYLDNISVLPIYKFIKKRKIKFLEYLQSFYYPFIIKRNLQEFDLIKQNQLLGSWVAIVLKFITKKKLFVRTGYDMFRFSKLENKNIFVIFLYKLLTKITLYFSDLYTVSSLSDFEFVNKKFNNVDIEIRPNWILVDGNSAPNDTCFYNIISVGRLEEQKNYREAILALKDSDYIFTIYGEGSQKEMLLKLAKDKNVKLTIKNIIRNSELIKVYKSNNIFISTSEYEGNSKVILEAMASGCLVVAKEIDNNVELIDHGKNGYLYKDLKDLQRILSNIQKNQNDQMVLKSNAIKKVTGNNSFEVLVKKEKLDYSKLV